MRIDKFLANLWLASRKEIKNFIKSGNIFLNWEIAKKEDLKINFWDKIKFYEQEFEYQENIFLILNKPFWFVSSKVDEANHKSVYENLQNCPYKNILEIVWRLDFDTTWLMIFTNNWKIIHKLIHPKKNIFKKYLVKTWKNISLEQKQQLENWVFIDWDYKTKNAKVDILAENEFFLSIQEWKFHQIKKMLLAVWNEVIWLHRVQIWEINLWDLQIWEWRFLNTQEIKYLENL